MFHAHGALTVHSCLLLQSAQSHHLLLGVPVMMTAPLTKPVTSPNVCIHVTLISVPRVLSATTLTTMPTAPALLATQGTPTRKMAVVSVSCIKIILRITNKNYEDIICVHLKFLQLIISNFPLRRGTLLENRLPSPRDVGQLPG